VEELHRFRSPEEKLPVFRRHYQPEIGIDGKPIEYEEYRFGGIKDRWHYVRTRPDHQIDLSTYLPAARRLSAWAYAEIDSPGQQEVTFVLATHGPADLWINEQHVHHREDFHLSNPTPVPFQARLADGANRLMVRFEQVAVRECPYSMSLRSVGVHARAGAEDKVISVPTRASSPEFRLKLEDLFEACHLRQDVFTRKEMITVFLPDEPVADTPFNIRMQLPGGSIYAEVVRDGRHTEPQQPMGYPYQSPEGGYQLRFLPAPTEFYEGGFRISRMRRFYA
jgi:hypothetical protein